MCDPLQLLRIEANTLRKTCTISLGYWVVDLNSFGGIMATLLNEPEIVSIWPLNLHLYIRTCTCRKSPLSIEAWWAHIAVGEDTICIRKLFLVEHIAGNTCCLLLLFAVIQAKVSFITKKACNCMLCTRVVLCVFWARIVYMKKCSQWVWQGDHKRDKGKSERVSQVLSPYTDDTWLCIHSHIVGLPLPKGFHTPVFPCVCVHVRACWFLFDRMVWYDKPIQLPCEWFHTQNVCTVYRISDNGHSK